MKLTLNSILECTNKEITLIDRNRKIDFYYLVKFKNSPDLINLEIQDNSEIITTNFELFIFFKYFKQLNPNFKIRKLVYNGYSDLTELTYNEIGDIINYFHSDKYDNTKYFENYIYDSNNRLIEINNSKNYKAIYEYDSYGNLILRKTSDNFVEIWTYNKIHINRIDNYVNNLPIIYSYFYDLDNRIIRIKISSPYSNSEQKFKYENNNLILHEFSDSSFIEKIYNEKNQITKIIKNFLNLNKTIQKDIYEFKYDSNNNLIEIKENNIIKESFVYDNDKLIEFKTPYETYKFIYDNDNNIIDVECNKYYEGYLGNKLIIK